MISNTFFEPGNIFKPILVVLSKIKLVSTNLFESFLLQRKSFLLWRKLLLSKSFLLRRKFPKRNSFLLRRKLPLRKSFLLRRKLPLKSSAI